MKRILHIFLLLITPYLSLSQSINEKLEYSDAVYYQNPDTTFDICHQIYKEEFNDIDDSLKIEVLLCLSRYNLLKNSFTETSQNLNDAIVIAKRNNYKNY